MKLLLIVATAFLIAISGCKEGEYISLTVQNPATFQRMNETVAVSLDRIGGFVDRVAGGTLIVSEAKSGKVLTSQVAEGELIFQADFEAGETKQFFLRVGEPSTKPQSLVDARFVLPREDYAWENDRIAFRMYGPALAKDVNNGIDVWTKKVRHLIVEKWYKESEGSPPGKDTYHEDRGEGADFFSVGRTLGAGSSGLWLGGRLHQPGVFASYKTLSTGPIRASFELTYDWRIDGKSFVERKRITLDAGRNLNRIDVTFDGLPVDSLLVAAGLVKRASANPAQNQENGWLSLWGLTTKDSINGFLGTGIVFPPNALAGFAEDSSQYVALGRVNSAGAFTYYAGAGWTRSGDFENRESWQGYLDSAALRLRQPLQVSITEHQ